MRKYAFRRLLQLIPILFAITFLSYGMMRIAGSDVVTQKMENTGQILSEDKLNAAREQLGLDKPFLTQYFVWLGKLLHGDMGNSYVSSLPVFDTFISKLPATLLLTVTSIFADYHHINPSGDSVSSKTEYDHGLSDPFMQLYRKQSS